MWGQENIHDESFEVKLHTHCNPPTSVAAAAAEEEEGDDEVRGRGASADTCVGAGAGGADKRRQAILIGIHLCRRLSSRFIELANSLGPAVVAKAVLAPCCLPGPRSTVTVRQMARIHRAAVPEEEAAAQRKAKWDACWRCGRMEHSKANCTATDEEAKESRQRKKLAEAASAWRPATSALAGSSGAAISYVEPVLEFDPSNLLANENPFSTWCDFLMTAFNSAGSGSSESDGSGGSGGSGGSSGDVADSDSAFHTRRVEVQLKGRDGSGHTYGEKKEKGNPKNNSKPAPGPGANINVNQNGDDHSDAKKGSNWNESRRTTWLIHR